MPSTPPPSRTVWLHGFASDPSSSKASFCAARLRERGEALWVPDLNQPDFRTLTVSRMLAQLDEGVAPGERVALVGSSLGGYTAALWAARNPARVTALALLAPAFDLAARWQSGMPKADFARWETEGAFPFDHHARGRKELLDFGFLTDARTHPAYPLPQAPTLVIQGTRDTVVVPELAREFAARMRAAGRTVSLVEVDEGHELNADLPGLWRRLDQHLAGR